MTHPHLELPYGTAYDMRQYLCFVNLHWVYTWASSYDEGEASFDDIDTWKLVSLSLSLSTYFLIYGLRLYKKYLRAAQEKKTGNINMRAEITESTSVQTYHIRLECASARQEAWVLYLENLQSRLDV